MAGNYDKFTPVIQLDEITGAEEALLEDLAAIAFQNGDLIYYNGSELVRLGIGSSGQMLTVSGGIPAWITLGTSEVTGPGTSIDNTVVRWNGGTGTSLQGSNIIISDIGVLSPSSSDGGTLGSGVLMWGDLFLASGGVINWNAGDVTLTHSANLLTLAGGDLTISGALIVTGQTTIDAALSGLLVGTAGVISATSDATSYVSASSLILAGKVELATTAEINTGSDSTRAMPVDQYVASNRNIRYFNIRVLDPSSSHFATNTIGGDFEIPFTGTITEIGVWVDTAGAVGGACTIDVNLNAATIMAITKISVDTGEKTSRTAATPPVLSTTAVTAGDIITVDIDAINTTPAMGLVLRLGIRMT